MKKLAFIALCLIVSLSCLLVVFNLLNNDSAEQGLHNDQKKAAAEVVPSYTTQRLADSAANSSNSSISSSSQTSAKDAEAKPSSKVSAVPNAPTIISPTGQEVSILVPQTPIERFPLSEYEARGYGDSSTEVRKPYYPGTPTRAYIHVPSSGAKSRLDPNQGGEFQRVYVDSEEEVEVRIQFNRKLSRDDQGLYAVASQDGGVFENGQHSALMKLDELKELAFRYYASPNDGTHRVTVTSMLGETQKLDFWVGEEVKFAKE